VYLDFYDNIINNFNIGSCIHCLAGFGRTGTFALMYLLVLSYRNRDTIYNPRDYYRIDFYRNMLYNNIGNAKQIEEVFKVRSIFLCKLIQERINLITLSIALVNHLTEVSLIILGNNSYFNVNFDNRQTIYINYNLQGKLINFYYIDPPSTIAPINRQGSIILPIAGGPGPDPGPDTGYNLGFSSGPGRGLDTGRNGAHISIGGAISTPIRTSTYFNMLDPYIEQFFNINNLCNVNNYI
jgi:hypothetical protein